MFMIFSLNYTITFNFHFNCSFKCNSILNKRKELTVDSLNFKMYSIFFILNHSVLFMKIFGAHMALKKENNQKCSGNKILIKCNNYIRL